MTEGETKLIAGRLHKCLRCAVCDGLVWIRWEKNSFVRRGVQKAVCDDCLPPNCDPSKGESDMQRGTGGGRFVDRRKGES